MLRIEINIKRRYLVLLTGIILIITGSTIATGTQSNFGTVNTVEVDFRTANANANANSLIHSTLQVPVYASSSDPLPGIVVIHGSLQNKEWLMGFGIELARRGFVVLTIDANGHGNSDPGSGSGTAALEYIASLPYVNDSSIGLIGHSMGGGISWNAINESDIEVSALVLVGAGVWSTANTTFPHNMLIAVGKFDELSSYPGNLSLLKSSFGEVPAVNQVYGDFRSGTARKIIFGDSNHLTETMNPTIIAETVEWMKDSLKGTKDEYWVPKENQTYPIFMVGGLIATIGAFLSILPILVILIDLPFFAELKKESAKKIQTEYVYADNKSYLWQGLLYGIIGFALFLPLLFIGQIFRRFILFPQRYGLEVGLYFLGSSLAAAGVLMLIIRFKPSLKQNIQYSDKKGGKFIENLPILILIKTFLLAFIVTFWLYCWTILLDIFLAIDFRCFLPVLNDLTPIRMTIAPVYLFAFIPYFFVEGKWLMEILKTKSDGSWKKSLIFKSLKAMFVKCIPYLLFIAIQYGVGYFGNIILISGYLGYLFLFFYMFTPMFAVSIAITVWCYHLTNRSYLGAILNGLIFSWILASILPI
ncbi:MAG: alpha/beta hydrolase family protein [Promethearchaeota archaeon]